MLSRCAVPECSACGSTDVALRMGKNGKPYLIDTRRPHFCPKRPKNGAKPKKGQASAPPEQVVGAAAILKDMNYTKAEAAAMLKDIPVAGPQDMVLAALKRKGGD